MKSIEQLEHERRLNPCTNCDTSRERCKYECGEETHWAARLSLKEIAAIGYAKKEVKA